MSEMPSGWVQAPLGQVATSQLGRMLSASRETGDHAKPYLRNRDVQWGHINVDELPVMDFGPSDAERFLLRPGDMLVCEGGEVGRAAIWRGQLSECYYQKALHRVRTSVALLPEFLLYLLEHYARTRAFERYTSGSTIAHLPQEDLRNLPVPIPPAAEQGRIVAAIEEQFSRLDAGVAALERARKNLKRLRAVSYRQMHDTALSVSQLRSLREICVFIVDGDHNPPKRTGEGIPYLTAKHVKNGHISTGGASFISHEDFALLRRRYDPRKGDVLVTCVGTLGEVAVVPDGLIFAADRNLAALRPAPAVTSSFLEAILRSPRLQKVLTAGSGSTAQPHLYLKELRQLQVPIPALETQESLIVALREQLAFANRLEMDVKVALARSGRLRSSILTAAFSGSLVRQDSHEVPASILLEDIAAKQMPTIGHKRAKTRKSRTP